MSQRSSAGGQRQRHGVAKNLAEGMGGLVVGAAIVVLARDILRRGDRRPAASPQAPPQLATTAADPTAAPQSENRA
jgi:hypothetical protein